LQARLDIKSLAARELLRTSLSTRLGKQDLIITKKTKSFQAMATVEVTKAVDRLPPIIAVCNTKTFESLESVEAVNPPEEAPAAAAKDIAHMNISKNPGTPQRRKDPRSRKLKSMRIK